MNGKNGLKQLGSKDSTRRYNIYFILEKTFDAADSEHDTVYHP